MAPQRSTQPPVSADADLLVVGGGITGLSLAVHAARDGQRVVLLEAEEQLGGASTQRSGALVRTHYVDPGSARLALRGLQHFEAFEELYGGPAGFRATGFAFVPEAWEVEDGTFASRVDMLRATGVDTELLDEAELRAVDPSLDVSDVGVVAYEPRSGHAVPAVTTATLVAAARCAGADLRPATRVASLLTGADGTVGGVTPADGAGTITASTTVLCAGAHSAPLAAGVGVELPVRPTAVKLAFVERQLDAHLTVIDAPGGIYFRPDADGTTLVGRRTWTDEPLASPASPLPAVEAAFCDEARRRLAARMPNAAGARVVGSRAGMLDMTPDGLPLVGPSDALGLWLNCGWSGAGFKTGPSVGEALARWLASGERPADLQAFNPSREIHTAEAVRSPH